MWLKWEKQISFWGLNIDNFASYDLKQLKLGKKISFWDLNIDHLASYDLIILLLCFMYVDETFGGFVILFAVKIYRLVAWTSVIILLFFILSFFRWKPINNK